jgi:hypothetical protein
MSAGYRQAAEPPCLIAAGTVSNIRASDGIAVMVVRMPSW